MGSYEPRDTSDCSADFNDPPAPTLASMTSLARPSSIGGSTSLVGLGLLESRSSQVLDVSSGELKTYTVLSTPPRRDGHSADTSSSPERRRSAPSLGDKPGTIVFHQAPLDVAADASYARNPAIGVGHQLTSIPESAVILDEAIMTPTGVLTEIDGRVEVNDMKIPGGSSQIRALNRANIHRVDDLGEYLDYCWCSSWLYASCYKRNWELVVEQFCVLL